MKKYILLNVFITCACTLFTFSGLQAFAAENDNKGNIVICQDDQSSENPFLMLMQGATKTAGKINACNNVCTKKRHECERNCAQSSPSVAMGNICYKDCRNEAIDCSSNCNQQ